MVVDIFPEINIPVVAVATFYKGMGPSEVEGAITLRLEQAFLQASYIEHIESRSLPGVSLIKIYFHPSYDVFDGREHVPLEVRFVPVALGVRQHKRKLGHEILEVVDHECGHSIERVELPGLEQRFGRAKIAHESGGLATRRLEDVEDLPIDIESRSRVQQNDKAG